jgi:hypothetical protein
VSIEFGSSADLNALVGALDSGMNVDDLWLGFGFSEDTGVWDSTETGDNWWTISDRGNGGAYSIENAGGSTLVVHHYQDVYNIVEVEFEYKDLNGIWQLLDIATVESGDFVLFADYSVWHGTWNLYDVEIGQSYDLRANVLDDHGYVTYGSPIVVTVVGTAPVSNALQYVLASIWADVNSVWTYDANPGWRRYVVGGPDFLNDLTTMESGKGYWVDMNSAAMLTITGYTVTNTAIQLRQGWNLVGYNPQVECDRDTAIASIVNECASIWTYDGTQWLRWVADGPPFLNNLTQLEPGCGYWINVSADCVWNISP